MQGYTIKSESSEGIYYLVKNWEKNKTFWNRLENMKQNMLYKTESAAKASITKLLKSMPEYKDDKLTVIYFDNDKQINIDIIN